MRVDGQVYVTVGSCGCWSFEPAKETCIQGMVACSWHVTQYLVKSFKSQKTIT